MVHSDGSPPRIASAQRLSASQRWASASAAEQIDHPRVLNAFRHHRGGHSPVQGKLQLDIGCSTPFGITEVGISHRGQKARTSGACSTPFGITEVGMGTIGAGTITTDCAQRLSASQRWASDYTHSNPRYPAGVLNAFRHHRGGHNSLTHSKIERNTVLNAFRHHRGGHAGSHRSLKRWTQCSTPFGITEVGIRRTDRRAGGETWVLNAFRHHRGGHGQIHHEPGRSNQCAQRLSASQRWA